MTKVDTGSQWHSSVCTYGQYSVIQAKKGNIFSWLYGKVQSHEIFQLRLFLQETPPRPKNITQRCYSPVAFLSGTEVSLLKVDTESQWYSSVCTYEQYSVIHAKGVILFMVICIAGHR